MTPPINIDGTNENYSNVTIDGQTVEQITIDGQDVLNTIPNSGDLHARYDATELSLNDGDSISTWSDQTGNGHDLTETNSSSQPTFKTSVINGNPIVRFDGSDDELDVAFSDISEPFSIFAVYIWQGSTSLSGDQRIHSSEDQNDSGDFLAESSNNFEIKSGSGLKASSLDNNPHIFGLHYKSTDIIRQDGSQTASGNAGTSPLSGFTVGDIGNATQHGEVDAGEILIYPQDKSGIQSDVESYLSNKWGITL